MKCNLCKEREGNVTSSHIFVTPLCTQCSEMDLSMAHERTKTVRMLKQEKAIMELATERYEKKVKTLEGRVGYKLLKLLKLV